MFHLTPLTGTLGAQVDGLDLSQPLGDATEKLRAALDEYKVLVFHDQHAVGPAELVAFAEHFGEPEVAKHPSAHLGDHEVPGIKVITSDAADPAIAGDSWHTDGATRDQPAWLTILQSVDVPPFGRDTLFADMEAIYKNLSEPMQQFLEGRTALHSWGSASLTGINSDAPPVEHPLIRINPRTGRKSVYVNRMYTRSIVGLHADESNLILDYLYGLAKVPEVQFRVSWRPGTITMWDNEATMHYGVRDYGYRRVQHRVMVAVKD